MIHKLEAAAFTVIMSIKGFFADIKNDESGMEIVQVVLLILVGVLAIVAIWGVLDGWLGDLWDRITEDGTVANSTIG